MKLGHSAAQPSNGLAKETWPLTTSPLLMHFCWRNCGHRQLSGPIVQQSMNLSSASHFPVKLLDHAPEIVLAHVNDPHFTAGVCLGVTGVSGVDHDVLAELPANRSRRRLRRIGRAENVADFAHCFDTFINQRDTL